MSPRDLQPKSVRLNDIILAFQAFNSNTLKAAEAADVLLGVDIGVIEVSLQKIAKEVRRIGKDENFPDLLTIADNIEKRVGVHC